MLRKWAPYYFYHLWTRVRCCIVVGGTSFSHTHFAWLGWHMNIIILIKITDVCSTFLPLLHIIIIFWLFPIAFLVSCTTFFNREQRFHVSLCIGLTPGVEMKTNVRDFYLNILRRWLIVFTVETNSKHVGLVHLGYRRGSVVYLYKWDRTTHNLEKVKQKRFYISKS